MKAKTFIALLFILLASVFSAGQRLGLALGGTQFKVTGCLRSGTESNSYILSNASGTYDLVAESGVSLKNEIGHKVEVIGTLTKENVVSSNLQSPVEKGSLRNPFTSKQESSTRKEINVSSIRHISNTCR